MKRANFYSKISITQSRISDLTIPRDIQSLRILHSSLLSMQGISIFKLKEINLSSNKIQSIQGIQLMRSLERINLSNNKIKQITCMDNLTNLQTLILFNNQIESLDGLRQLSNNSGNQLKVLDLRSNKISNLRDLEILTGFGFLQQVSFDVGKATNPICDHKTEYNRILFKNLRPSVKKIDNKEYRDVQQSIIQPSKITEQRQNRDTSNVQDTRNMGYEVTRMEIMELEKIISFKDLILEEMKTKNLDLTTQLNQRYKELVKREHELERTEVQNEQLQKRGSKKDKQLSELQTELNEMMKNNGKLSKQIYNKNTQMQRYIKEINELKLENAEYRAVVKDNERKISDFHSRTLQNVNCNTIKMQQIKNRYQKLRQEHSSLVSENYTLKQRIQELNQICRQWQFKFERAHDQYLHSIEKQLRNLQQQHEKKVESAKQQYNQDVSTRHVKYKSQLDEMESKYEEALKVLGEKCKKLKKQYDQLARQDGENKEMLKMTLNKNSELQRIVDDSRLAFERCRRDFVSIMGQKEALLKQLQHLKATREDEVKHLTQQRDKSEYQKSYLQRQLLTMKDRAMALEHQIERGGKLEQLNTAIDVKNQMLEDKNQTIQTLREEIKSLQQSEHSSKNQAETVNRKYNKNKQLLHDQKQQLQNTINQYEELKERYEDMQSELQSTKEQLASKQENLAEIDNYLNEISRSVKEKEDHISQLLSSIQECKRIIIRKTEETDIYKKQAENIKRQFHEKYEFYKNRDKQARNSIQSLNSKIEKLQKQRSENQKSRQAAKQNLQKLTKLLNV